MTSYIVRVFAAGEDWAELCCEYRTKVSSVDDAIALVKEAYTLWDDMAPEIGDYGGEEGDEPTSDVFVQPDELTASEIKRQYA